MPYGVIQNCIITHANSVILLPYIDSEDSPEYRINKHTLHDGINLQCTNVYSPCNAVVIQAALCDTGYCIILQYSTSICLRFANIDECLVVPGQLILSDTLIGKCSNYVHFEYLNIQPSIPSWIVRVSSLELYKHNPILVLDGSIEFDDEVVLEYPWPDKYFKESYPPGYIGGGG